MGSSTGHPSNIDSAPRLGCHSTAAPFPLSPLPPARPVAQSGGLIQPNPERGVEGLGVPVSFGPPLPPAPSVLRVEPVDATLGCRGPCQCEGSSWWCPLPTPMVGPFGSPLTFCLCSQQMDDAVYTFETLLHQEVGKLQGKDDLCKSIQRILERVLKVRGGRSGASVAFGGLTPRARTLGKRTAVTFPILIEVFWGNLSLYGDFHAFCWHVGQASGKPGGARSPLTTCITVKCHLGFRLVPKLFCQTVVEELAPTRAQTPRELVREELRGRGTCSCPCKWGGGG